MTFNHRVQVSEPDLRDESLSKVLTVLSANKKKELLQVVKQHNRDTKRLDNYTVIKGSTKNLSLKMSSERLTSNNSDLEDTLKVQASLQKNSVRGNGYLYSHDLIENLRSPFKNPFKSPLSEIDKIYNTNREAVTQMSDMLALITLKGQNKLQKDKKIDSIKYPSKKKDTERSPSGNSYSDKYNKQNAHTSHATLIRQGNDSSIVIEENNQNANTVQVDQKNESLKKRESSRTKSRRSFILSKNKHGSIFGYTGAAKELPPGLQEFREVQKHINMMRNIKKEEQEDSDSVYQYKDKEPIEFNDTANKPGQWKDIPSQEIQVNIQVEKDKNEQSEKKKKKSSLNDKGSKQNPS